MHSALFAQTVFGVPLFLPLACLIVSVVVVASTYMSPYMNGIAVPAPANPIAFRSAAKAALIIFAVLLNGLCLFTLHRIAVCWTLIALAAFGLLWLPTGRSGSAD